MSVSPSRPSIVLVALMAVVALLVGRPAAAAPSAAVDDAPPVRARGGDWCADGDCTTWNVPYYAHGSVYISKWKRCVHWEFRARVNYRVAEDVTGPGATYHMVEGLWLNRTRTKLQTFRYCDTEHDATRRSLGGAHVRPSLHVTNGGSGRCSMNPSVGFSFPWSVSVEVSPSCEEARIATRDSSMVSSKTQSTYPFSDIKPRKRQLKYGRYTTMLVTDDHSHPYNILCFRFGMHGSFEHPTRPGTKGFSAGRSRCVNLLEGD